MGWWPTKIVVLLNIVVMIGYSMIDCVVGGQILSAVSPGGSMSVAVGKFDPVISPSATHNYPYHVSCTNRCMKESLSSP